MILLPKQPRGFISFKYIKGLGKESLMIIPKYVSENCKNLTLASDTGSWGILPSVFISAPSWNQKW